MVDYRIRILEEVFKELREKLVQLEDASYPYSSNTDEADTTRIKFLDTLKDVLNDENTDSYDESLLGFTKDGGG